MPRALKNGRALTSVRRVSRMAKRKAKGYYFAKLGGSGGADGGHLSDSLM